MTILALTLPTIGQPNSTEDVDIVNAFTAIQNEYNANIAAIQGAWKPLSYAWGFANNSTGGAATYVPFEQDGNLKTPAGAGAGAVPIGINYVDPADYAISGYTTQIRLKCLVVSNSVSVSATFTMGLYPLTATSLGGGAIGLTLGAVHCSAAFALGANEMRIFTSSAITMPAANIMVPGVVLSAAPTANSFAGLYWHGQYRYI